MWKDTVPAEANGAVLGRKCCAEEPLFPLTLPSNTWLCATPGPQFSSGSPTQRVSLNWGSQGSVVSEQDLEGPWGPDPRSSCSHVAPLRSLGTPAPALFGFRAVLC